MDLFINYLFIQIINFCLTVLDFITDYIFGYSWTYGPKKERLTSEGKAHILKIIHKGEKYQHFAYGLSNFILKHDSYEHDPEVIIRNEHVTLFAFDTKYAIFVLCKPWENILDVEKHPFTWLAQFNQATHLILLPLKTFNEVTEENIGNPTLKVTLIQMTSRCGSTLLTQIMSRVPGVQSWSETNPLIYMQTMRNNGLLPEHQIYRLLMNAFRVLCVQKGRNISQLVFKWSPICNGLMSDILKEFPHTKVIFNTRNIQSSLKSLFELKARMSQTSILSQSFVDYHDWNNYYAIPEEGKNFWKKIHRMYCLQKYGSGRKKELEVWLFNFCLWYSSFFWVKSHVIKVVFYEDLCRDFEKEVGEIFDLLEIPRRHLNQAVGATQRDSQGEVLGKSLDWKAVFTPKEEEFIDTFFSNAKLPIRFHDTCEQMKQHFKI